LVTSLSPKMSEK